MADIQISVNNRDDLFMIQLDKWEWTGLKVDGVAVNPINNGNIQFEWVQKTPGIVHFEATANQYIDLVNDGNVMFLKSTDDEETYFATISYKETENPKVVTLKGTLQTFNFPMPQAKKSPELFSQGRMTGRFSVED